MDKIIFAAISLMSAGGAMAATHQWVQVFHLDESEIQRVLTYPADSMCAIAYDFDVNAKEITSLTLSTLSDSIHTVRLGNVTEMRMGANIPSLYIVTAAGCEITSKTDYSQAAIRIVGNEETDDFDETEVSIRGRGNTSWGWPKKPYRLKFDKKQSLCGMKKAKSYTLIANYVDHTLMRNALALKAAELMGMPYTNHCVPVNLWLNGTYRGSYFLSEKIGFNSGSIDDIDETKGILWEWDLNYDETYKFISPIYGLPVMVNEPDLDEITDNDKDAAQELFSQWQGDFREFEAIVALGGDLSAVLDYESLANYLVVYTFALNYEINNPKSQFLHKEEMSKKYKFGPVWDFDWAFTYHGSEYPDCYSNHLLVSDNGSCRFMLDIVRRDDFWRVFQSRWEYFDEYVAPQLLEYMEEYAQRIRVSAYQNGQVWPQSTMQSEAVSTETFDENYAIMKNWVERRIEYMRTNSRHALY